MAKQSQSQLKTAIGRLSQGRVLVVGDVVIDEMMYGTTARLSREAPVIILRHQQTDILLGGATNAAHNIAKLGARGVTMVGVAGKDYYCSLLLDAMERDRVDARGLVQDESRPTSTKTRVSGIANQSVTQQIVRIDRESTAPVSPAVEQSLLDKITQLAPEFDAILLSDYGLGVVTPAVIDHCRQVAKTRGLVLTVDSHQSLAAFKGATVLTPNQPEAEANVGFAIRDQQSLLEAGQQLLGQAEAQNVLITRGGEGMALFEQNGRVTEIPAFNRSEVFDVTGAGDTVIGMLTLALASGVAIHEAAILGNLAASIVVKRFGASTTTPAELLESLDQLDPALLQTRVHQLA